jgi:uncharacterized protein involved in exopolysaccharide biosynthesis
MNQNLAQSDKAQDLYSESEISLKDILRFLKGTYKIIAIANLVGIGTAVAYLTVTPKQYVATAQIAMAQIGVTNNNKNDSLNTLGINIEEPSLVIARLSQPTSFPPQVLSNCGIDAGATLVKSIKLAPPKGVTYVLELKTFANSPQEAMTCANAIFELIKATQAKIVVPYIEQAKTKLADDEERLAKARDLILKADKLGLNMGVVYLSTRDEIRFLLDEIAAHKSAAIINQGRPTRLISPIYASNTPISPKKSIVLAGGLFGGLFLGLLIALAYQALIKLNANTKEQGHGKH